MSAGLPIVELPEGREPGPDCGTEFRSRKALLKTGALQDAIFKSAHFSCIATDEKGVIQIFNVGAERMLGYAALDVVNRITPADISDPQEVIARAEALSIELGTAITPGFEALVYKASRGIEDIYELTYIRKDDSRFPAIVSVTALRDAQNSIIGYLLIGTDNTIREQVEADRALIDQRLRDQQFYTRSLIESNIDALMTTDPRGIISDVNQQMVALTGRTRDELIGAPCKKFFTDPARADAAIRRVLIENKVSNFELTVRALNGRETVVSYNAATYHDRDRKLQGVFAAARDVTDLKRFERALKEKNELEHAVRMKSEFLASMSHELRTPLNAILGFTGTLLMKLPGPLNAEQDKQLSSVQSSALRLLSLINDMLELAGIESGRVVPQPEPVACKEVLDEVATALRQLAEAKGLAFGIEAPGGEPMVRTDRQLLTRILIKLTNNAIKFTDRGTVKIELSQQRDNGLLRTRFSVVDTGPGISAENQAKLFQAFEQLGVSDTRRHEGTGLGLHLSQKLAALLGGRIEFESEAGKGSRFTLALEER